MSAENEKARFRGRLWTLFLRGQDIKTYGKVNGLVWSRMARGEDFGSEKDAAPECGATTIRCDLVFGMLKSWRVR